MKLCKGHTVKVKGHKTRYLITKVSNTMVKFISLDGKTTGSFDTRVFKLKRV